MSRECDTQRPLIVPTPFQLHQGEFISKGILGRICGKRLRLTCSTYQALDPKNNRSYQDFSPCHLSHTQNASPPITVPSHITLAPHTPPPYLSHPTHPSPTADLLRTRPALPSGPHSMANSPSHRLHLVSSFSSLRPVSPPGKRQGGCSLSWRIDTSRAETVLASDSPRPFQSHCSLMPNVSLL